jgi:hypothetical protein
MNERNTAPVMAVPGLAKDAAGSEDGGGLRACLALAIYVT